MSISLYNVFVRATGIEHVGNYCIEDYYGKLRFTGVGD